MVRGELRARILALLNESATDPSFWSLDELNQLITEGQETLAEEVEGLTRTFTIPLRPGVMFYPFSGIGANIMTPWRAWTYNREHRLWPLSMRELDGHYERWLTVTGEPEWWFLLSWDVLGIWPAPTTGGGIIEADCFVWPSRLLDDDDEPELPNPDHDWLPQYARMEGQVKQWDIAQAVAMALPLFARARDSQARNGLRTIQERFFARTDEE